MTSRIRVPILGGGNKSILINQNATIGAQIGLNLLMPDGTAVTPAKLAAYIGVVPTAVNASPNAGKVTTVVAGTRGPPGDDGAPGDDYYVPILPLSSAAPSSKVGLTATLGNATTAMRSDAAPALDVTISPTMTGNWTFSPGSGVAVTFNAANGQAGFTVNGAANSYCNVNIASATNGQSYGVYILGGTTAGDQALHIANQAGTATFCDLFGDGHGTLGPSATTGLKWDTAGKVTFSTAVGLFGNAPPAQVTGFGTPTGTGVIANFPGATATLAQCSQAIAQLIKDYKAFGAYAA